MHKIVDYFENKSHVIWDWNGTLLNDVDLCVSVIGEVLKTSGLEPISRDRYRAEFCFPVLTYYQSLGFDFEKTPFSDLSKQFVSHYNNQVRNCALFRGVTETLATLKARRVGMSILSAAHQGDLVEFLDHYELTDYFDHVCGLTNHYAQSKIDRGVELLKLLNVRPEHCVLVGDTDHDVEVAEALGIDMILLGDGHQSADRLRGVHPKFIPCRYSLS